MPSDVATSSKGHARARDECLEQHVARAQESAVAAIEAKHYRALSRLPSCLRELQGY
jgi:hypothetical protein